MMLTNILLYAYLPWVYFLWGNVCSGLLLFLIGYFIFLLLSFKSSKYVLDKSPLSDVSFADIFSQYEAGILILLALYFVEQKFSILIKSSLSTVSVMDHGFHVVSKK